MTTDQPQAQARPCPAGSRRFLARFALMALIWLGLNGADWGSWIVGGPVVLAATGISLRLPPANVWRWSARGAIAFAGFFLRTSLRGGWDVAWRALSPKRPLAPEFVRVPFHLPPGPGRLFFCGAISLLPGTAVVAITEDSLLIHALDHASSVEVDLRELEVRVAALFGLARWGKPEVAL